MSEITFDQKQKLDLFTKKISNSLLNQIMIGLTNLPSNWYIGDIDYRVNELIKISIFRDDMFHVKIEIRADSGTGVNTFHTYDDIDGKSDYEDWMHLLISISKFTQES